MTPARVAQNLSSWPCPIALVAKTDTAATSLFVSKKTAAPYPLRADRAVLVSSVRPQRHCARCKRHSDRRNNGRGIVSTGDAHDGADGKQMGGLAGGRQQTTRGTLG